MTNAFDRIIDRLDDHGFWVCGGLVLELDVDRMRRMYHHCDDPPEPTGNRDELPVSVLEEIYAVAPACVVMLAGRAEDLGAELVGVKGDKRPTLAAPGSVRRSGHHLIFNTLHSPDDEQAAEIELAYLVGAAPAEGLMALARSAGADDGSTAARHRRASLAASLPAMCGWEALSYPMIANRIRTRIVQRLAIAPATFGIDVGVLDTALGILEAEREAMRQQELHHERLLAAREHDDQLTSLLLAALGESAGDGLRAGVTALSQLMVPNGDRQVHAIVALADDGIYVSPLERIAIDAHRYAIWADDTAPASG
ncbi:MAG: hypothetical protein JJU45_19615 [Acidimicrobiia bacterium]|nr:hypothetical protein [Acidimicrobiia bacterium]